MVYIEEYDEDKEQYVFDPSRGAYTLAAANRRPRNRMAQLANLAGQTYAAGVALQKGVEQVSKLATSVKKAQDAVSKYAKDSKLTDYFKTQKPKDVEKAGKRSKRKATEDGVSQRSKSQRGYELNPKPFKQKYTKPKMVNKRKDRKNKGNKRKSSDKSMVTQTQLRQALKRLKPKLHWIKERHAGSQQWTSDINKCAYNEYVVGNTASIAAVMNDIIKKVVAAGAGNGTWQEKTLDMYQNSDLTSVNMRAAFKPVKNIIRLRNGTDQAMQCWIWSCSPKSHTSDTPKDLLISDLDDFYGGDSAWETEFLWWPKDCPKLRKEYKVTLFKKYTLRPGDEVHFMYKSPRFTWDEFRINEIGQYYHEKMCRFLLFRTQGMVVHDQTTTSNVGLGKSVLDLVWEIHYEVAKLEEDDVIDRYQVSKTSLASVTTGVAFDHAIAEESGEV